MELPHSSFDIQDLRNILEEPLPFLKTHSVLKIIVMHQLNLFRKRPAAYLLIHPAFCSGFELGAGMFKCLSSAIKHPKLFLINRFDEGLRFRRTAILHFLFNR